jgi:hypothetical protein
VIPYQTSGYEVGTYMEIYLPKRTIYQPFLFDVLTKGFDLDHVRTHFQVNRNAIDKFLDFPAWHGYSAKFMNRTPDLLFGYSMYEVDGVFRGLNGADPIVEERTQVIRLMFRIDHERIADSQAHKEPRYVRARISDYLRAHRRDEIIANAVDADRGIVEAARNWRDELGFFIFGYVIYEFCRHIHALFQEGKIAKLEEEIWVMHLANLELDRVQRTAVVP